MQQKITLQPELGKVTFIDYMRALKRTGARGLLSSELDNSQVEDIITNRLSASKKHHFCSAVLSIWL